MNYLIAAYVFIFVALFGYIFSLARRQRDLRRELEDLKQSSLRPAVPVPPREQAVPRPQAQ